MIFERNSFFSPLLVFLFLTLFLLTYIQADEAKLIIDGGTEDDLNAMNDLELVIVIATNVLENKSEKLALSTLPEITAERVYNLANNLIFCQFDILMFITSCGNFLMSKENLMFDGLNSETLEIINRSCFWDTTRKLEQQIVDEALCPKRLYSSTF